ncbi:MAG: helix-turn-helix domain-containing protein [Xanthobacteraceae bacterium]
MTKLPACIESADARHACDACLRDRSNEHLAAGLSCAKRQLGTGQDLFVGSDPQNHVYLIRSGAVCLYNMQPNGRRQIVAFKFAGDFIIPLRNATHRFSAQAMTSVELRQFPLAAFRAAASQDARFLGKLHDMAVAELSAAYDLISILGHHDAEASVAAFLLDVDARAALHMGGMDDVVLPMLRTDIADYLGLSHETISRILTSLKRRDLIDLARGRTVQIKDRSALAALAGKLEALAVGGS